MRMVIRVHNAAADGRTDTHVTFSSGFADIYKVVIAVAHNTYGRSAYERDLTHLTGGKTQGCVLIFLGHQLRAVACAADQLSAMLRIKLNIVYQCTDRDRRQRQELPTLTSASGPFMIFMPSVSHSGARI